MFNRFNLLRKPILKSIRLPTSAVTNSTFYTPNGSAPISASFSSTSNSLANQKSTNVAWGTTFADTMLLRQWNSTTGWQTPQLVPYAPLPLSPASSVLHYGFEVFEGMKAFRGKEDDDIRLFRPYLNAQRINNSANRISLPTQSPSEFVHSIGCLVNSIKHWVPSAPGALYLRPSLIGIDAKLGVREPTEALFFIIATPAGSYFSQGNESKFYKGIRLFAETSYVRAWPGGMGSCKAGGNYAGTIPSTTAATQHGYDQVLWLSDPVKRNVSEAGVMNIFFVLGNESNKTLVTPCLDGTILEGVTRKSVIELAKEKGICVEERDISMNELSERYRHGELLEIFTTGTGASICPVKELACENDFIHLADIETLQSLSYLLRNALEDIQTGDSSHPWIHSISDIEWKEISETDELVQAKSHSTVQ